MSRDTLAYESEGRTPLAVKSWYRDRKVTPGESRLQGDVEDATFVVPQSDKSETIRIIDIIEKGMRQTRNEFYISGRTVRYKGRVRRATVSYDSWALSSQNEVTFEELATVWRKETGHLSSITKIVMHPAYQSIIGMGPSVVPLLLRRLQVEPEYWFWALAAITRQNPIRPEDAGDTEKMAQAWIQWAKQKGIVF